MAGHVRVFNGVQKATTAAANATVATTWIPAKFASQVVLRVRSTTAETAASMTFNVANGSDTNTMTALSATAQGYVVRGTGAAAALDRSGGQSVYLAATDASRLIYHDRIAGIVTAPAGGLAGPLTMDIEVYYNSEADFLRAGQAEAVPV